jgi:vibriolysin
MKTSWLVALGVLSVAACSQGELAPDTVSTDAAESDVQRALHALPRAEVLSSAEDGVPSFVRGNLGTVTTPAAQISATSADVQRVLAMIAPVFRLAPSDLVHLATTHDDLGGTHIRYAQMKSGLRVVGGELLLHIDASGTVNIANGSARDGVALSETPTIDGQSAAETARLESKDVESASAGAVRLVFLRQEDESLSLAWEVHITGERESMPVDDLVYIDAGKAVANGAEVLARYPQIHSALNRTLYTANHATTLPGTVQRSEGGAAAADSIVNTNYNHLGTVHSFYSTLFNRDSYDGHGAEMVSTVHYSSNFANAFWNPANQQMVYGDGDGFLFSNLAASLDVTGHELTHAVTERTAGLVYSGESGGLNESMSDVMGEACEAFRDGGVSANTWLVGEDIWTPGTAGDALRYLNDPARDGRSIDTYLDYVAGTDVHYTSGIANLAFFLASQGGTHPRARTAIQVPAITESKAAKVWYRALTTYMVSSTSFAQARTATVQAAEDLYGAGSAESVGVAKAWTAVAVGPYVGADCLFNWAEVNYAGSLAPAHQPTTIGSGYTYRYYPGTNSYVGISYADGHVGFLGPDGKLQDLGPATGWFAQAGCKQ